MLIFTDNDLSYKNQTNMKAILLSLTATIFIFSSCSKSNPNNTTNPSAYITADIDGVYTNFDYSQGTFASTLNEYSFLNNYGHNVYGLVLSGAIEYSDFMSLTIFKDTLGNFLVGSYSNFPDSISVLINYANNATQTSYFARDTANITITSIDSISVQGTFSGQVDITEDTTTKAPVTHTITNGKFNLPFK